MLATKIYFILMLVDFFPEVPEFISLHRNASGLRMPLAVDKPDEIYSN